MHATWFLIPTVFLPFAAWAVVAAPVPRTESKVRPCWVNFALGGGRPGVADSANVTWQGGGEAVFQLGVENNETFQLFGSTPEESVTSVGLLMGFRTPPALGSAALLAGPAWVSGFHRGQPLGSAGGGWLFTGTSYEKNHFSTVGLMANAQLFWKPFEGFGLGLQGNACWNQETSTTSALVSLQLSTTR